MKKIPMGRIGRMGLIRLIGLISPIRLISLIGLIGLIGLGLAPQAYALIGGRTSGGSAASGSLHNLRQPAAVTNGLIGWWKLDEVNSAGTTADSSGNGLTGTLNGFDYTATSGWNSGKYANAIKGDGTNDYITMGDVNAIDGLSAMSVSLWVKPTNNLTGFSTLISKAQLTGTFGWIMESGDTNKIYLAISATGNDYASASSVFSPGVWTHLVMWYDGSGVGNAGRLKLYVNGVDTALTYAGTIPATVPSTTYDLRLLQTADNQRILNGTLDDVRIYNRAITQAEVTQLYGGSKPTNCDQTCVGYWKMDDFAASTTVVDSAGANTGTAQSNTNTISKAGAFNGALTFSSSNYVNAGTAAAGATNMTMSLWAYPTSGTQGGLLYKLTSYATANYDYYLYWGASGGLYTQVGFSNGTSQSFQNMVDSSYIQLNQWQLITVVKTGTLVTMYRNGVKYPTNNDKTLTISDVQNSAAPLIIGRENVSPFGAFNGYLDDVRIYNRALSAYEINEMYLAGRP